MSNILNLFTNGVLNYLFLASLLAVVLTVFLSLLIKVARIRAPVYLHMIWQYALIGIILFPAIWLYGPRLTFDILPAANPPSQIIVPEMDRPDIILAQAPAAGKNLPEPVSTEAIIMDRATSPRPFPLKVMLVGIWFYGSILMLLRLCIGWYRLRRICLSAEPVPENSRLENGYGRKLRILLTSQVNGPGCFGLWQPVILLPREMYNEDSSEDLHMVLSHELAHIERRDCRTNLLQRVVEAIFFFHPFVWYVNLQLTQQREQICDNYVIHKGAHIMDYSNFLSRITEQKFEKIHFQAVALFEGRLLQRIRALLDPKRSHQIKAPRWVVLAGAFAATACLIVGAVRLEARPNTSKDSVAPQDEVVMGPAGSRPKGNCSISGKVISAETGQAIKHAKVMLLTEENVLIVINVASDGTFIFKDIPTGPFSLRMIDTLGFQDVFYNPGNQPDSYPRFSLADAEQRVNVVLKAQTAWSITGNVLDENGERLKGQRLYVQAWAESIEPDGQRRYQKVESRRIESDGSYALNGLDGRPVYVMVFDPRSEFKDDYYPPCYYPGTVDRNKAQKVTFDEKMSVENIDIHLRKKGEHILEGVVTDEKTGDPIPKTLIVVHHKDMLFDHITVYTDEQGRYRIESIGTGVFLVQVDATPWGFVRTRKALEVKTSAKTTVLDFKLREGVEISGNFVDENGNPIEIDRNALGNAWNPSPPDNFTGYTGATNRYRARGLTSTTFVTGEGDYFSEQMIFPTSISFIIQGVMPGNIHFHFHPRAEGQMVKKIVYNGQNITETGIATQSGQKITGITIVIQKR